MASLSFRSLSATFALVFIATPILNSVASAATPAPALPKITSFAPLSVGGGESFTITGSNLLGATTVSVGGSAVSNFKVVSKTSITATLPSGSSGGIISLTTPAGTATSAKSLSVLAPKITAVAPLSLGGGELLTLAGVGLTDVTSVTVGGKSATDLKPGRGSLQVRMPIGAVSGPVVATSVEGTATAPKSVTVIPPKVTAIAPLSLGGGEPFTVAGDSLTDVTSVTVGGKPAQFTVAANGASLKAIVPAGATTGPVVVTAPEGTVAFAKPLVIIPPQISAFAPASLGGGDTLTISGVSLADTSSVTVGGVAVDSFQIVSKTTVTAKMHAGSATGVIVLTTPEGTATTAKSVTVVPPAVTSLVPAAVPAHGTFTIRGVSLSDVSSVSVNGKSVESFQLVNSTTIRAVLAPDALPGHVEIASPEGTTSSTAVLQVGPTVDDYNPKEADVLTTIQVDGLNFTRTGKAYIGRTLSSFKVDNDLRISLTIPYTAVTGPIKIVSKDGLAALTGTSLKVWGPFPDASCTNTRLGYLDEYSEGVKSAKYIAAIDSQNGTADGTAQGTADGRAAGEALTADDGTADGRAAGYPAGYNSTYSNSYTQWYNTQYNSSYATGKSAGQGDSSSYNQGATAGYNAGYSLGNQNGSVVAYNDGYDDGYPVGQDDGDKRGYSDGVSAGESSGYSAGDSAGYSDGRSAGYTPGYNAGADSCTSSSTTATTNSVAPAAVIGTAPTQPAPAPSPACPVIGSLNGYTHNPIGIHSANDAENYCFQLGCSKVTSPYAKQYAAAYKPAYNRAYADAKAANSAYQDAYHSAYSTAYSQGAAKGTSDGKAAGISAGNNDGYNDGYRAGAQIAYNNGYNDSYQRGYNAGYSAGYYSSSQYNRGYSDGHSDGYNNTYSAAYNEGVNDGYNDSRGYPDGYSTGYDDGYNVGYNDGYNDGANSCYSYSSLAKLASPSNAELNARYSAKVAKADRPNLATLSHIPENVPNPGIRTGALPAKNADRTSMVSRITSDARQEAMLQHGQAETALPKNLPAATAAAVTSGEASLHQALHQQLRATQPQLQNQANQALDQQLKQGQ